MKRIKKKASRFLTKKLLAALPEKLRYDIIRNSLKIPFQEDPGITYKLAETESEFQQAYSLLHDSYVEQGFIHPQKSGMRLLPHFILPNSVTLVAVNTNKEVVGTLTIIKKSALPLPMEKEFSLEHIKSLGENYAEISALAVKRGYRRANGGSVFLFMLNFMYHYCVDQLNLKYLSIVIHPRDEDFYAGLMFFKRIPNQDIVNYMGAPALAMYLDLDEAYIRFDQTYSHLPPEKDLLAFFMRKFGNLKYVERPYYLTSFSTVTPEIFTSLFVEKGHIFDLMSYSEYRIVKRDLLSTNLAPYLDESYFKDVCGRSEVRVTANMRAKAVIDGAVVRMDVSDVSGAGIRICLRETEKSPTVNQDIHLQIDIGSEVSSKVLGKVIWEKHPYYGVKISQCDQEWSRLVDYLYCGSQNYLLKVK